MGRWCALKGCINSKNKPVNTIYAFPDENTCSIRRKEWMDFIPHDSNGRNTFSNYGICNLHFEEEDYKASNKGNKRKLHNFAVPTLKQFKEDDIRENVAPVSLKKYIEELEQKLLKSNRLISEKAFKLTQVNAECERLKNETKSLKQYKTNYTNVMKKLSRMFSPGQLRLFLGDKKFIHWKEEDMTRAIALHSVSSKCYRYLKENLLFPLPTERSIRNWLSEVELQEGIIRPVMNLLKGRFYNESKLEKICVLGFDEMAIDDKYCYDSTEDRILGNKKNIMVFSIRGLFSSWKQIVYYSFDGKVTKDKVFEIIKEIHEAGLNVVALVHDMSTKNVGLWKELGTCQFDNLKLISSSFENPVTKKNCYVFPDFPHLLKLLRNHFIDNGITLPDGTLLEKKLIQDLLSAQKNNELKLTFKLTHKHINVKNKERMRVRLAFQLFSKTVSKAIEFCSPTKQSEARFFKLINDFSDVMNVRVKEKHVNPFKSPFGMNDCFEKQTELLEKVKKELQLMRVGKRVHSFSPFQKGLLISVNSLQNLYADMKKEVNCEFIMTTHLNQDYIENLFSVLRGIGKFTQNPTVIEAKARLKRIIFSWNFVSPKYGNVLCSEDTSCVSAEMLTVLMNSHVDRKSTPLIDDRIEEKLLDIVPEIEVNPINIQNLTLTEKTNEGAQEYLAGYIAKKLLDDNPELAAMPFTRTDPIWVNFLSDNLLEPSTAWFAIFKKLNQWFEAFHYGGKVNLSLNVMGNLKKLLEIGYPSLPKNVISYFVKVRTMVKIKQLNKAKADEKYSYQSVFSNEHWIEDDNSEFILNQDETIPALNELIDVYAEGL